LLIFDEVKTGAKTCLGRRQRLFRRKARHDLPGEIDWRRLAFGCIRRQQQNDGTDLRPQSFSRRNLQHERVAMAAGLATFREVLTRENYVHVGKLSKELTEGYRTIVSKVG